MFREVQLDSLVGPTHQFAGLSLGNLASMESGGDISSPKKAALEGIDKMRRVIKKGVLQLFFPPQDRPVASLLQELGKDVLYPCYSSSYMWTANAATSTPSLDSLDRKHHLTPANLCSNLHRHLELAQTERYFQEMCGHSPFFHLHPPLPSVREYFDEGAANHTRLAPDLHTPGLHLFVYGKSSNRFPARQAKNASVAIANTHRLPKERVLLLEQNPAVINLGVFHNDVISVGHLNLLLVHEKAYLEHPELIGDKYEKLFRQKLRLHVVKENDMSVETAVKTYFFNSQILSLPNGKLSLLAPKECEENREVKHYIENLPYFDEIDYISLRESMKNGGGPACLRLRLFLNEKERDAIPRKFWMDERKADLLSAWVNKEYPSSLKLSDLHEPAFAKRSHEIHKHLLEYIEKL